MHRLSSYSAVTDGGVPSLPREFVGLVIAFSVLPYLLMLAGVNLGTPGGDPGATDPYRLVDAAQLFLWGSFIHTLLEWSAFMVGVITFTLAIAHFSISRDLMVPIIGMALFCAAAVDAFHTLAAGQMIDAMANNREFIPFTWAVSRIFNALILIIGISILLIHGCGKRRTSPGFVIATILAFGLTAYYVIHVSETNHNPPQTIFPGDIITRPWDVGTLLLLLIVGGLSYRLFRLMPSYFSGGLLLSVIPAMATEIHMAFGSTALFDSNFNAAHGLKILSYAVPLIGLCIDYMKTYQSLADAVTELAASQMKNQAIVNVAVNGIITFDENGVIDTFNPAAERIFGYDGNEVIGQNISTLLVDKPDSYQKIITNGTNGISRETTGRRKNGSTFPLKLAIGVNEIDAKKLFLGYAVDITPRKDAEAALISAKEKAEKASQAKSSFLSMMSHELRTPLTCIIGNLPLLGDPDDLPEPSEIAEIAADISESGDHLLAIINDLLDFSKIEAGEMQLDCETIDVDDVVYQAAALLRPMAKQKSLRLIVASQENTSINADPIRLKQIFINLIGNAIKFTGDGEIRVDISTANGAVTCSVRDTGVGVPEEMLPVIFDKFRQADSSPTRKAGGTGLGLAITKSLIEMHGGKIRVENNADGGSLFSFSLPTVEGGADGNNFVG